MGVLIDTGVLIDLERSQRDSGRLEASDLPLEESGFLAAIVVSELLHGVHRASGEQIRARRGAFVRACLDHFPILAFDRATAETHSRIWSDLQRTGSMIGSHDLLIAATAIEHGIPLLTGNLAEYERVPGLEVLAWQPRQDGSGSTRAP